jgi:pimeloyl-ACP methyl ester carboxylesterase
VPVDPHAPARQVVGFRGVSRVARYGKAVYVVIHGGGESGSAWDLVAAELRGRGHGVVAPDLPTEDDGATLWDYADSVVEAIGARRDLVVVAHSLGGFTAPLVCARLPVDLLVLVAGMIPSPGETANEWWAATGYADAARELDVDFDDPMAVYYHDVAPDLAAQALAAERGQSDTAMREPWPLERWPDVPTRFLLCRDDRVFPAAWLRELVRARLGIEPDEIDGGHCPYLSRPRQLAERLEGFRAELDAHAG